MPLMKKDIYFERYAYPKRLISKNIHQNLGMIVVIPCHNEDNVTLSLKSLLNSSQPSNVAIEVLVVINHSTEAPKEVKDRNQKCFEDASFWAKENSREYLQFHIVMEGDLPPKDAGVGLARKIGMDEALFRLSANGKENGVIVCFDADSLCEDNYLDEIYQCFHKNPKTNGVSIHYEHPLEGNEFEDKVYEGITAYEFHLRYYTNALKWTGHPHAFQTIGSSMAVRTSAYKKQGGMNKRKAGEDFYFLQKIISLGNFGELNSTMVIPSPRTSDRVPFGTGRAIKEWINGDKNLFDSYHYLGFEDLKKFFGSLKEIYENGFKLTKEKSPQTISSFLKNEFESNIIRIKKESKSYELFRKKFFSWFNAFKVLKFLHFCRDEFYENIDLNTQICPWIFNQLEIKRHETLKENLKELRSYDKKNTKFSDF